MALSVNVKAVSVLEIICVDWLVKFAIFFYVCFQDVVRAFVINLWDTVAFRGLQMSKLWIIVTATISEMLRVVRFITISRWAEMRIRVFVKTLEAIALFKPLVLRRVLWMHWLLELHLWVINLRRDELDGNLEYFAISWRNFWLMRIVRGFLFRIVTSCTFSFNLIIGGFFRWTLFTVVLRRNVLWLRVVTFCLGNLSFWILAIFLIIWLWFF